MKIRKINSQDIKLLGNNADEGIRQLRSPLLIAYDKYKTAVNYGEIVETEQEHLNVVKWAQRLRDKDATALDEVPEKVKYYL